MIILVLRAENLFKYFEITISRAFDNNVANFSDCTRKTDHKGVKKVKILPENVEKTAINQQMTCQSLNSSNSSNLGPSNSQ